jgi:Meckel syndrome type 1 protein
MQTGACEMAGHGRIFTVALGSPFVCPGCGNGLAPPVQRTQAPPPGMSPFLPVALTLGAALLLGGAVLVGRQIGVGAGPVPPRTAVALATPQAVAPVPAAAAPPVSAKPAPREVTVHPAAAVPPSSQEAASPTLLPAATPVPALAPAPVAQAAPAPAALPGTAPQAAKPTAAPPPSQPPLVALAPPAPPPPPRIEAASQALPRLALPGLALPGLALSKPALAIPAPAPLAARTPPPAIAPQAVPDVPFSPVALAGGLPDYPASLAADGRAGRVTVTCLIQSDGRPQACRTGLSRGGPAFAASALAWLERGRVRFRVPILHGRPAPGPQSWAVTIEEPQAALAEARRRARAQEDAASAPPAASVAPAPVASPPQAVAELPAPPPARPVPLVQPALSRQVLPGPAARADRGFSARVVRGGAPEFPKAYEDEARSGTVTVRCTIEENGAPTGCDVLEQTGGQSFGRAVSRWLGSGRVRFAPIVAGGQPVSQVHTWTVTFRPPPT